MELATFLTVPGNDLISALSLAIALGALLLASVSKRRILRETETLRQRTSTLSRELDDLRVQQFDAQQTPRPPIHSDTSEPQYQSEKAAYDQIWPQLWKLHDSLGAFLRAVEHNEPAGDLRLDARNAALDARQLLNRNRPFCDQNVEELTTRLIDTEIKAHLTACEYLDLVKDTSIEPSGHDRRVLHDKCHALYEGEARDLMNRLVSAIRQRMLNVSYS
ncbi:hypothetical protein D777_01779 [Marinobacter nitratireducens]|uniref:Uncharacterized protein n=1 Tax=Marinobacter nitratireducens TaxID=1137280 RepID=A0A072NEA6_9GAMM|nr:hypothetical protein [Marinobacter nitratireducens]KEF31430.1 hypothetical protein D777_01779 [Marinobacter nitratireducens]